MIRKPSFLERLTGSVTVKGFDDDTDMLEGDERGADQGVWPPAGGLVEPQQDGELPVDMYHTGDKVVIKALVAGVSPEDLDIAITRDMVTIKGIREQDREASDEDY